MTKWFAVVLLGGIGVATLVALLNRAPSAAEPGRQPASSRHEAATPPQEPNKESKMVQVKVFNRRGELVGPVASPRVELSDAQWRKLLTPEQFVVLRSKGTEQPFCGTLLDNKKLGVYTCAGCGLPLFSSDAKFDSGTGWPSYFQPIAKENVAQVSDGSHFMVRTEILCARCDGHLGHVFDDGPKPTGLRFCLNSESLSFTPSDQLATLADPAAEVNAAKTENTTEAQRAQSAEGKKAEAVFGGGCFWCTEASFAQLNGVLNVESGYSGGAAATADYESVCTGRTGHAEVIRIQYDPAKISYEQLLDVFFDAHDPTQLNGQGNDLGTQYRSVVFYESEEQKRATEAKIAELDGAKAFRKPIVTTLEPLVTFYPAEQYHQKYVESNPGDSYVLFHALPKVCKIREKHAKLVKP